VSDEKTITEIRVRNEHLREINEPAHWIYLLGVLVGGLALMLFLLAMLGGGA
jgi:hypothetical protein